VYGFSWLGQDGGADYFRGDGNERLASKDEAVESVGVRFEFES
jgi:hypothetical protein